MKRREFITRMGGAAVAWPRAARAQQPGQVKRVGVLIGNAEPVFRARYEAFREALAQVGWTEPGNIRIDYCSTDSKDQMRTGHQSHDRQCNRSSNFANIAIPRRRRDRVRQCTTGFSLRPGCRQWRFDAGPPSV